MAAKQLQFDEHNGSRPLLRTKAESIAWTENGEFILLMNGEDTKHVIVAANVIAVTES